MKVKYRSDEITKKEIDVEEGVVLFFFLLFLVLTFLPIGNFLYEEIINSVYIPDEFINSLKEGWSEPAIRPFLGKNNWGPTIVASILGAVVLIRTLKSKKGMKGGFIVAAFVLVVFGVSVGGPRLQHNINERKNHMIVPFIMLQVLEKRGGPYKETNEKYYKTYCGLLNEAQKDQNLKHSFRSNVVKEIGEACSAFYSGN